MNNIREKISEKILDDMNISDDHIFADMWAQRCLKLVEALEANNFALQCMIIHFNGNVPGLTEQQVFEGAIDIRDKTRKTIDDFKKEMEG